MILKAQNIVVKFSFKKEKFNNVIYLENQHLNWNELLIIAPWNLKGKQEPTFDDIKIQTSILSSYWQLDHSNRFIPLYSIAFPSSTFEWMQNNLSNTLWETTEKPHYTKSHPHSLTFM